MSHKFKFIIQSIKNLRWSQKGSTLIEFALVFPILITIILSTLELGIMLAIKVNLQSCVQSGAYYGQSGQYTAGSTATASAQAVMMNGVSGLLNPSNLVITTQSFPTFAAASSGGSGTPGTGNEGEVGMYKMQYTYSASSPLVASFFGATKVLTATTYVKNEETFP
jgi:Flp pilus assembly protein TadG